MKKAKPRSANAPWFVPSGHLLNIRTEWLELLKAADGKVPAQIRAELVDPGGTPVDDDGEWESAGRVALVNGLGPVSPDEDDFFCWLFGGFGLDRFMANMRAAAQNPDFDAIVMRMDSPGGDAAGNADAADEIRALSALKPIVAWVPGMSCSASYYLSAGSNAIVASQQGILGSIGTRITFRDSSEAMKQAGIETIEFISSVSPRKSADPTTEDGAAQWQALVDEFGELFVNHVAQLRGVSAEKVLSDYGQGGVLVGAKALDAGLADEIGTLDDAVSLALELAQQKTSGSNTSPVPAMPFQGRGKSSTRETSPTAGAAAPGGVQNMDEKAIRAEAAQAERVRIAAIRKIDTPANRLVAAKELDAAYEDGSTTAAELALVILEARDAREAVQAKARSKARNQDGAEADVEDVPEEPEYKQPTPEEVAAMRARGGGGAAKTQPRKINVAAAGDEAMRRLNGQSRRPDNSLRLGEEE